LAKIEGTFKDHIFYKRILAKEIIKGDQLNRKMECITLHIKNKIECLENLESQQLVKEKAELLQNVINLSEEVRFFYSVRQLLRKK
jgi:hypothetical protein